MIDAITAAEDDEEDSIPDLVPEESNDEIGLSKVDMENHGEESITVGDDELSLNELYFNMTCVKPEIFVNQDQVCTQVFCDYTLQTLINEDKIVNLNQIRRGPQKPSLAVLERWAAGDGGASEAASYKDSLEIWDKHTRDQLVIIYRKNVFLEG